MLAIVLLALLQGAPAFAAEQPSVPTAGSSSTAKKSRTLKEVVDLALTQGADTVLNASMAERCGFGKAEVRAKKLRYKQTQTPDKREHTFNVVVKDGPDGKLVPVGIALSVLKGEKVGDVIFLDGMMFRVSFEGTLERAVKTKGKYGAVENTPLSTGSSSVKKQFRSELDFHTKDVVALNLEPVK